MTRQEISDLMHDGFHTEGETLVECWSCDGVGSWTDTSVPRTSPDYRPVCDVCEGLGLLVDYADGGWSTVSHLLA